MAESYSVKAILSATDSGFSSTLKGASGAVDSLASKIKSGFTFGLLTGAGQAAFSAITSGAKDLVSEIDASNAAWKTFTGNMEMLGKSADEIDSVKKELQSFAETTVYSSSDMATTFAQLEAVGVKNTTSLVKGFGGLAAAAENPQQAMKTLSTQATQMAAKPKVAWADFKLMLEQTPAGIAAIAKEMGMSTAEMVTAVQEGEVATDDFFNAITKVGTNDSFSKLATESKTVGQAMDGLKETIGNKLTPAFDLLSQIGIDAINGIADKLGEIDGEKIANKVSGWIEKAQPYWESFKEVAAEVGGVLKKVGTFFMDNADTIAKALPYIIKIVAAYKGFQLVKALVPGMSMFTNAITSLAGKGIGAIAGKLFGISSAQSAVGTSSAASGKQMLTAAQSMLMMGAAVLLISAGFALLAQSAIALSDAGGVAVAIMAGLVVAVAALGIGLMAMMKTVTASPVQMTAMATAMIALGAAVLLVSAGFALLVQSAIALSNASGSAIAILVGFVAVIALLAVGAAAIGPALTAGAVGLIAFGVAMTLVGAAAVLAAAALAIVSAVLPTICEYGTQGATAIAALGASLIVFAGGTAAAGAAILVLTASMAALAVGVLAVDVAVIAFGASMLVAAAGTLALLAALAGVGSSMKTIASNAAKAEGSLISMQSSISVVESGLDALGSKAKSAMKDVLNAFDDTAKDAKKAGEEVGKGFTEGLKGGLEKAPNVATQAVITVNSTLKAGYSSAYSAGAYISQGFAAGMLSCLGTIQSAAARMAAAADAAVRAKAKIHSPSKVSEGLGEYWGEGFVNGIAGMAKDAWRAAENLVSVPNIATPNLAGVYGGEMSADFDYYGNSQYTIEVPLTMDGKQVAKATAVYTQDELNKLQRRENRKKGIA